jgi:hypothetical protein
VLRARHGERGTPAYTHACVDLAPSSSHIVVFINRRYDLQLLRDEVQRQPQSFVGGMLGGLQRAMLAGSSMRGDPASFGLWAALLMKLRTFLTQSAKLNLLLTQVLEASAHLISSSVTPCFALLSVQIPAVDMMLARPSPSARLLQRWHSTHLRSGSALSLACRRTRKVGS